MKKNNLLINLVLLLLGFCSLFVLAISGFPGITITIVDLYEEAIATRVILTVIGLFSSVSVGVMGIAYYKDDEE